MSKETLIKDMDQLKNNLDKPEFTSLAEKTEDWGGADVIICSRIGKREKNFLGDQHLVLSMQSTAPCRRVVETKHSQKLSLLFTILRNIIGDNIDYITKYDFFGMLSLGAINFINKAGEDHEFNELANAVIVEAKRYVYEFLSPGSIAAESQVK